MPLNSADRFLELQRDLPLPAIEGALALSLRLLGARSGAVFHWESVTRTTSSPFDSRNPPSRQRRSGSLLDLLQVREN